MKRNKKLYIILSLIIVVGFMIIGYAAYNQKLNISETSKIDSNFNILITNIEIKEVGGEAINNNDPIYNGLEASFDITFNKKNDYIEYNVEVSNRGNIEAYLNQIKIENEKSKVVSMSYRDINVGDKLSLGESKTFVVRVEYLGGISKGEIDLSLEYGQENNPGEIILPDNYENYKVIYNTEENGGEKAEIEEKNYNKGESIDLSNKGKKEGYTFLGWNTDKDSKEAIKELTMGEEDITLYAIYKKTIEVRYKIGEGISETPKEKDTCEIYNKEEECSIELPGIESIKAKDGRVIDGWYKGTEKIENNTQKVRENSIYEIKAYTNIPAEVEINTSTLSNRIRVVTNIINNIEIEKYEYSIDNGDYIESNNTYSFDNLEHNTEHTIKIRVTTKGNAVTEKEITVRTLEIATPTFTEETEGIVKINYPEECNGTYTCTYIKDGGEEVSITKNPEEVIFGSSGTIIAKVTDGTNYITSSTYTVERTNLYVSNSGNDTNGYGTKEAPYLTLNKAYDCASLTQESTIYVMNNITQTETALFDENKTITLTSYSEDNSVNSVIRGNDLIETVISLTTGSLNLDSIIIDGNNVEAQSALVYSEAELVTKNGTIIRNNDNKYTPATTESTDYTKIGGGICVYSGTALIEDTKIQNNSAHGGGGIYTYYDNELTVNNSVISDNTASLFGGGIGANADVTIKSTTISNNTSLRSCGGISFGTGTLKIIGDTKINNNIATYNGGGINIGNNAALVIENGIISGNSARNGGGIYGDQSTTVTIKNGDIINNTANVAGGGLYINTGNFNMLSGNVLNNSISGDGAGYDGGGILLNKAISKISGGAIKSNISLHSGGGIQAYGGELTISGGEISNNSIHGLGLYNGSKLIIKGGTISNNENSSASYTNNFNFGDNTSSINDFNENYTIDSGSFFVTSALNNNFVLDVVNGTVANSTNVQLYTKSNVNKQKWRIYPYKIVNGTVDWIFKNQIDGTQYLWVNGNSTVSPANVITYMFHGNNGGYWRLINQGNDYYQLKNIGGLCAYVASAANGTNVSANTCQNTNNFKWKLVKSS